jgi:hypothetical protein
VSGLIYATGARGGGRRERGAGKNASSCRCEILDHVAQAANDGPAFTLDRGETSDLPAGERRMQRRRANACAEWLGSRDEFAE